MYIIFVIPMLSINTNSIIIIIIIIIIIVTFILVVLIILVPGSPSRWPGQIWPEQSLTFMVYDALPVFVNNNTPFARALALQSFSRNCNPAHDLVLWMPVFPPVFFPRGVFISQTPVLLTLLKVSYHLLKTIYGVLLKLLKAVFMV